MELVAVTDGVTGAFIKELRDKRAALTRSLLGHRVEAASGVPGMAPPPSIVRAIGAAGLPIPPGLDLRP